MSEKNSIRVPSICRSCTAFCPIIVTVEDGRAVKVEGDREAPLFDGYSCPKGRALPEAHNDPSRLTWCRKRTADGGFRRIASEDALYEIAEQVQGLVKRFGPRAIATYNGTGGTAHSQGTQMMAAWLKAIGSPMSFGANAIDKPAANIANALHGSWIAGPQTFDTSTTWLIVGANPVISKSNGAPANNPGKRLKDAVKAGMKIIVIDPRRTETAQRAAHHLQGLPGEDPAILAGLIHIILAERLHDAAFLADHAEGLDALQAAVAPFTPAYVAARAGLDAADIVAAARTFATAQRGCAVCSTGPSFSTRSNLSFYLTLCLNTLCGRWARTGEVAPYPNVLLPAYVAKAQARAPFQPVTGAPMRVRGLAGNASGMPTAALPDEILTKGEGQVRALFIIGGNPVLAFPDQLRTTEAMKALDLLVVFDGVMSATAEHAHYVMAPALSLEVPGSTYTPEMLKYLQPTRGFDLPFAQYSPRIVSPPAGSDIVEESSFFFRLAQIMGLQIDWVNSYGWASHQESPSERFTLDMSRVPSAEELLEIKCRSSRIPLDEVKRYPHGHVFDEAPLMVAPADPHCTERLQLADPMMMSQLAEIIASVPTAVGSADYPFLLVSRRTNNFNNSIGRNLPTLVRARAFNPLYMHPDDIASLALPSDMTVQVRSAAGMITAEVEPDASLKRGVVAMTQGFGLSPDRDADFRRSGACVSRLVGMDECDPITGIPRMSGIPVAIEPAAYAN